MIRPIIISFAVAIGLPASQTFAKGGGGHSSGGHSSGGHISSGGHTAHVAPRPVAPTRTPRTSLPTNVSGINPVGKTKPASGRSTPATPPPSNHNPPVSRSGSPGKVNPNPTVRHDDQPPKSDGSPSNVPWSNHNPPRPPIKPSIGIGHKGIPPVAGRVGNPPGSNGGSHQAPPVGHGVHDIDPIAGCPRNTVPRNPPPSTTYPIGGGSGTVPSPGNGGSNHPPRDGHRVGTPGRGPRSPRRPGRPERPGHDHDRDGDDEFDGGISIGVSVGDGGTPASDVIVASGLELPPVAAEPVAAEPVEAEPVEYKNAAAPAIDLELVDVRLVDVGGIEKSVGPRLRLFCRNNGTLEAPKFQLSVIADIGKETTATAHLVTVESVGIKPGKTQAIDVQLPVEVLKMTGATDKWPKPFDVLVAIADSDDSLRETNKDNNVLKITRDAIKPLDAE